MADKEEDILDHPLFSDGLPKDFQTNSGYLALAYIDNVDNTPAASSSQNAPPTPINTGPIRRKRSSARLEAAQPYGGANRLSAGSGKGSGKGRTKLRSRSIDGPLARESHLASYLCSIASDSHALPRKPTRMGMDTVWNEQVASEKNNRFLFFKIN